MAKDSDEDIYNSEGREEMVDESEITPEEEGFMQGYDEASEEKETEESNKDEEE